MIKNHFYLSENKHCLKNLDLLWKNSDLEILIAGNLFIVLFLQVLEKYQSSFFRRGNYTLKCTIVRKWLPNVFELALCFSLEASPVFPDEPALLFGAGLL